MIQHIVSLLKQCYRPRLWRLAIPPAVGGAELRLRSRGPMQEACDLLSEELRLLPQFSLAIAGVRIQ